MNVRRLTDPVEFADLVESLGGDTPGRHSLILGLAGLLVTRPEVYPEFHMWSVEDAGRPVLAGLRTLPYNLVLTDAPGPEPVAALVAEIDGATPGLVANRPTVDWGIDAWLARGGSASLAMAQGVFAAASVEALPPPPPGLARLADRGDRDLLIRWVVDFGAEATPASAHPERIPGAIDRRLDIPDDESGFWLWVVDGAPVAMSGHSGRTGHGIRVGPVYTPPEHRGRGYATALVAEQTRWLLERNPSCFLYTDLANPTSNGIYQRIGYRQVGESAEWHFTPPG